MSRSNRVVVIGGGSGMGLAVELAPLRVNAVSPGWTDTTIWDGMTGMSQDKKKELFAAMADAAAPFRYVIAIDLIAKISWTF